MASLTPQPVSAVLTSFTNLTLQQLLTESLFQEKALFLAFCRVNNIDPGSQLSMASAWTQYQ